MSTAELQHIPLDKCYLCEDCSAVGNSSKSCPACASRAIMGLSGVLNRPARASAPFLVPARRRFCDVGDCMGHVCAPGSCGCRCHRSAVAGRKAQS